MSDDYFRDKVGARSQDDKVYAGVNQEEASEFLVKEMRTSPARPLAVFDVEDRVLSLNEEEHWSLVSYAVSAAERASRDHYGLAWEMKAQEASEVESAEQYAELVSDDDFRVNLMSSDQIVDVLEDYKDEKNWNFVTANDVAGIPTEQDYDDL
jgi:hypothetical protein